MGMDREDDEKATGMTPKTFYELLIANNARAVFEGINLTYDVNSEMAFSHNLNP
jgi:hypothetical protein